MVRYGKREKRVALYLRVSTGEQTTANQRRELEASVERHGWTIAATFEDAGISGAKGRDKRPGLDAMLKAVARRECDMVMAWSVDRLGRSLVDLLGCRSASNPNHQKHAHQRQAFRRYAALRASSLGAEASQHRGWSTLRSRSWSRVRRCLTPDVYGALPGASRVEI
jgi:hypothetical protein